jgi:YD repeat-containing protein
MARSVSFYLVLIFSVLFMGACSSDGGKDRSKHYRIQKIEHSNGSWEEFEYTDNLLTWHYSFKDDGTLRTKKHFLYDENKRLIRIDSNSSGSIETRVFHYDEDGRIVSADINYSDGQLGEIQYSYDEHGNLEEKTIDGNNIFYYYKLDGRLSQIKQPVNGGTVYTTYYYDGNHSSRLSQVVESFDPDIGGIGPNNPSKRLTFQYDGTLLIKEFIDNDSDGNPDENITYTWESGKCGLAAWLKTYPDKVARGLYCK